MTEYPPSILSWIWHASIDGTLIILAVLIARPVVRRLLGAQAAHALWLIVLIRLFAIPIPTPPSIALLPATPSLAQATENWAGAKMSVSVVETGSPPGDEEASRGWLARGMTWMPAIWGTGAGTMILLLILRAWRAGRLVRRSRDISQHASLSALKHGRHVTRFCETKELQTPALCGLFRPTVLLPAGWVDRMKPEELHCILSHELGHIRRGDLFWKWAFLLARSLHWFNPLVWVAERRSRADQEMACDEWVLSRPDSPSATCYGETLLTISSRYIRPAMTSPLQAAMAESKSGLKNRIQNLARFRAHGWKAIAVALILASALLAILNSTRDKSSLPAASPARTQAAILTNTPDRATLRNAQVEIKARFVALPRELAEVLLKPSLGESEVYPGTGTICSPEEYDSLLRNLRTIDGIDLLSAPSVTTRSGQMAQVDIVKEFRYPVEFALPDPKFLALNNVVNSVRLPVTPTAFDTRSVGITISVEAVVRANGMISCVVNPSIVDFIGFMNYGGSYPAQKEISDDLLSSIIRSEGKAWQSINQPVFETRSLTTSVALKSGYTAILSLGDRERKIGESYGVNFDQPSPAASPGSSRPKISQTFGPLYSKPGSTSRLLGILDDVDQARGATFDAKPRSTNIEKALYVFLTVRSITASNPKPSYRPTGQQSPSPSPAPSSAPATVSAVPFAMAVPGKPGYVKSPFAPDSGLVDVRGFPSGTEVKCPYTGKIFIIP